MALARTLAARGAKPVFAVRDLANIHLVAKRGEMTFLQAPVWPDHRHRGYKPTVANYADVLTGIGFADPQKLSSVMLAWEAVLDFVRPDLVISDHSPALQTLLHGGDIPVVAVGTPFTMPPLTLDRLPPLRADQASALPESRLLQSAKSALAERGRRAPARLVDLLRTDERLVFGLPELDPYRAFREEPILAPPEPLPGYVESPITPRLFVYVGEGVPYVETLVQALVEMDIDIVAYLRGDVGPLPHFLKHRGHKVYDTPPPLDEVLPTVSHVLSQGGAFTSQAALAAGRPHLMIALHNETELNLQHLSGLGVARRLEPGRDGRALRSKINDFVMDIPLFHQARHWGVSLQARKQMSGLAAAAFAVARCLERRDQMRSSRLRSAAAAAPPSR
jgi:hypothetical protein